MACQKRMIQMGMLKDKGLLLNTSGNDFVYISELGFILFLFYFNFSVILVWDSSNLPYFVTHHWTKTDNGLSEECIRAQLKISLDVNWEILWSKFKYIFKKLFFIISSVFAHLKIYALGV